MSILLLFDVDGTLVSTGGAGRRAMSRAFAEVVGDPRALEDIAFGGMTDRSILRVGLERVGRTMNEEIFSELVDAYLTLLREEVPASVNYEVMPHVRETLLACAEAGAVLGLGTGNVRRGAEIKLAPAGLDGRFSFGGFGDDAEDRAKLIATGVARGAAVAGRPVEQCVVVVIGDTPKDIAAAHATGGRCVAVATGSFELDALKHADLAVETLEDPRVLPFLLGE